MDFSLAIFWNICDASAQFWEEISKNAFFFFFFFFLENVA